MRVQQFRMVVSGTVTYDETKDGAKDILDIVAAIVDDANDRIGGCKTVIGCVDVEDTGNYDPENPEESFR